MLKDTLERAGMKKLLLLYKYEETKNTMKVTFDIVTRTKATMDNSLLEEESLLHLSSHPDNCHVRAFPYNN